MHIRCNPAKCFLQIIKSDRSIHQTRLINQRVDEPLRSFESSRYFHSVQQNQHQWSVLSKIKEKHLKSNASDKHACFLLNISDKSTKFLDKYIFIWDEANLKVAVDGSANYLAKNKLIHTADVVCGDFDSIDLKLIENLRSPTKPVIEKLLPKDRDDKTVYKLPLVLETPDSRETDFTKAIRGACNKRPDISSFYALYHSDGTRIDHLFGLVNTLHLIKKDVILVNIQSNTVSWLLPAGLHTIYKPEGRQLCSIVPFNGPARVKTQGLEYNIKSFSPLSFDGLISTSNISLGGTENIVIETNRELLFSLDLNG